MGVKKYTQEVNKEGKRVRWPKKDVFVPALITTIVICVFCALILSIVGSVMPSIYPVTDCLVETPNFSFSSSCVIPFSSINFLKTVGNGSLYRSFFVVSGLRGISESLPL